MCQNTLFSRREFRNLEAADPFKRAAQHGRFSRREFRNLEAVYRRLARGAGCFVQSARIQKS